MSSETKKDYVFAGPMDPSPTPVSVEVLLSDRLQLHLYQVRARAPRCAQRTGLCSSPG